MKKLIFAINGNDKQGKNEFIEIVSKDYFVWHRNIYDTLTKPYDWKRTAKYWKFIEELRELLDEKFNFNIEYYLYYIEIFIKNPKAEVLFLHAMNKNSIDILKQKFDIKTVHIHREDGKESLDGYDYVLNYPDENFEEKIKELMEKE